HGDPNSACQTPSNVPFPRTTEHTNGNNGSFEAGVLLSNKGVKTGPILNLFGNHSDPGFVGIIHDLQYLPSGKRIVVTSRADDASNISHYWLHSLDGQLKGSISQNVHTAAKIDPNDMTNYALWSRLAFNSSGSGFVYYVDNNSAIKGRKIDSNGKL